MGTYDQLMEMYERDKRKLVVKIEKVKLPFNDDTKSYKLKMSKEDTKMHSNVKKAKQTDSIVNKSSSVTESYRKRKLSVSMEKLKLPYDECSTNENQVNISGNNGVGTTKNNKNDKIHEYKKKEKNTKTTK